MTRPSRMVRKCWNTTKSKSRQLRYHGIILSKNWYARHLHATASTKHWVECQSLFGLETVVGQSRRDPHWYTDVALPASFCSCRARYCARPYSWRSAKTFIIITNNRSKMAKSITLFVQLKCHGQCCWNEHVAYRRSIVVVRELRQVILSVFVCIWGEKSTFF